MTTNLRDRRDLAESLEELSLIQGNGTSLISLYIPATHGQQARANDLLKKEITLCQSIKDRSVRNAVKNALTSTQQRFKSFSKSDFLPNGIALFVGEDIKNNNKMTVNIIKPKLFEIKTLHYSCGKQFDLSLLSKNLRNFDEYGIVVISGKELYIGSVCGEERKCLYSQTVDLPRKHCRGGQSQGRFYRQRL